MFDSKITVLKRQKMDNIEYSSVVFELYYFGRSDPFPRAGLGFGCATSHYCKIKGC